jgi:hypothetical protein
MKPWRKHFYPGPALYRTFLFWPLIVAGGRLVFRMVFNVWDMIEG